MPGDNWGGVDCTFYHGDETIANATKVVIDQPKYSGSGLNDNWTMRATDRGRLWLIIARVKDVTMRQKCGQKQPTADKAIKGIRRATRKTYSAEKRAALCSKACAARTNAAFEEDRKQID